MTINYNELVDYQVHSMNRFESLSDTMKEDLPDWTNNERPPFVPKTVTTTERKSFDQLYEEYSRGTISELRRYYEKNIPKGEIVILVGKGNKNVYFQ